jgi:hypothetical protein
MKISTFLKLWALYAVLYFLYQLYNLVGMEMQDSIECAILGSGFFGLHIWKFSDNTWNKIFGSICIAVFLKLVGITLLLQFKIIVGVGGVIVVLLLLLQGIFSWGASTARVEREEDCYPVGG